MMDFSPDLAFSPPINQLQPILPSTINCDYLVQISTNQIRFSRLGKHGDLIGSYNRFVYLDGHSENVARTEK